MWLVHFWVCHIHVYWRLSIIHRRYEGIITLNALVLPDKKKLKCSLDNAKQWPFSFPFAFLLANKICVGLSEREIEWTLWCRRIRVRQHILIDALSLTYIIDLLLHLLLHGRVSSRVRAFPVFWAMLVRVRACGRRHDDGNCKCSPQLLDGHHHRGWNSGFISIVLLFHLWS